MTTQNVTHSRAHVAGIVCLSIGLALFSGALLGFLGETAHDSFGPALLGFVLVLIGTVLHVVGLIRIGKSIRSIMARYWAAILLISLIGTAYFMAHEPPAPPPGEDPYNYPALWSLRRHWEETRDQWFAVDAQILVIGGLAVLIVPVPIAWVLRWRRRATAATIQAKRTADEISALRECVSKITEANTTSSSGHSRDLGSQFDTERDER